MARRRLNDTKVLVEAPIEHLMPRQIWLERKQGEGAENEARPDRGSTLRRATDYLRRCDE